MYVTHRSFAALPPAIRDFFWLYHTYSLLRRGFYNASSGFGLWAKTLRGQLRGGFFNASSGFGLWVKTLRGQLLFAGRTYRSVTAHASSGNRQRQALFEPLFMYHNYLERITKIVYSPR